MVKNDQGKRKHQDKEDQGITVGGLKCDSPLQRARFTRQTRKKDFRRFWLIFADSMWGLENGAGRSGILGSFSHVLQRLKEDMYPKKGSIWQFDLVQKQPLGIMKSVSKRRLEGGSCFQGCGPKARGSCRRVTVYELLIITFLHALRSLTIGHPPNKNPKNCRNGMDRGGGVILGFSGSWLSSDPEWP